MALYIGHCRKQGCGTVVRADYAGILNITRAQWLARNFDTTRAFTIQGVAPLGYCAEHGVYPLKMIRGRYSPDRVCDARCMGATGPACSCQCGGANHGASHSH